MYKRKYTYHQYRNLEGQSQWKFFLSHFFHFKIYQKAWHKAVCQQALVCVLIFQVLKLFLIFESFKRVITFARAWANGVDDRRHSWEMLSQITIKYRHSISRKLILKLLLISEPTFQYRYSVHGKFKCFWFCI